MKDHPEVEMPWMTRPQNSAATKFDFSSRDEFGYEGQMFLAEFGSGTPVTGDPNANGYIGIRINPETQEAQEAGTTPGPRRPVEAAFSPDGNALYITDIGVIGFTLAGARPFPPPMPGTGVIWRITKEGTHVAGPPANLSPLPPKINTESMSTGSE